MKGLPNPSKFLPLPAKTVERLKELSQRVATLEGLIALRLFRVGCLDWWGHVLNRACMSFVQQI
jgi:hypothetical protein